MTALLYGLLRPVSQAVSLAAALFSLVGCAIGAVVTLNLVAALILLKGAPYLAAFGPDQLQALAKFFLSLHGQGYNISIFFFGFYCALLGYLVFKSTFFPRWLGVLLAIAGLGWLADSFATALWPTFADRLDSYAMMSGGIGEGALCVWLIAAGVNVPKWQEQARVGANP